MKNISLLALALSLALPHFVSAADNDEQAKRHRARRDAVARAHPQLHVQQGQQAQGPRSFSAAPRVRSFGAADTIRARSGAGYDVDASVQPRMRPRVLAQTPSLGVEAQDLTRVQGSGAPVLNSVPAPVVSQPANTAGPILADRRRGDRGGRGGNLNWNGGNNAAVENVESERNRDGGNGGNGSQNSRRNGGSGGSWSGGDNSNGGEHHRNWGGGDNNGGEHHRNWGGGNFSHHHRRDWDRSHHDHSYWSSRYSRFALFGGGYYYLDAGYWYPAYGYDPYFSTYSYAAPIYAYNNLAPGEVISSVQEQLQQLGFYRGSIDGTYGPMTRRALLDYQRENGLPETGDIDEATLGSLGLE